MKKTLIVVGGSRSHLPFLARSHELGFSTVVFDQDKQAPCRNMAGYFFPISVDDTDKIISILKTMVGDLNFKGVFTNSSRFEALLTVAGVSKVFGLKSFKAKDVWRVINRPRLLSTFRNNGLNVPAFRTVSLAPGSRFMPAGCRFPVIVKPAVGGSGSRAVAKAFNRDQLLKFVVAAGRVSADHRVVVEEFVEGPQFNLSGYVCGPKIFLFPILRKHTLGASFNYTHAGYETCDDVPKDLTGVFRSAVRALGVSHYFFAADVIDSGGKFYVIDFGFLLDAATDRLFKHVGIDVYGILINLVAGCRRVHSSGIFSGDRAALRFIFAVRPGKFNGLPPAARVSSSRSVVVEWEKSLGDELDIPSSVDDAVGWLIGRRRGGKRLYGRLSRLAEAISDKL